MLPGNAHAQKSKYYDDLVATANSFNAAIKQVSYARSHALASDASGAGLPCKLGTPPRVAP